MPRSPEFQVYRDELSHKLQEIRQSDPENPEKAKAKAQGYLESKQETKEYQKAREEHLDNIEEVKRIKEDKIERVKRINEATENEARRIEMEKETPDKEWKKTMTELLKEVVKDLPVEYIDVPNSQSVLLKIDGTEAAFLVNKYLQPRGSIKDSGIVVDNGSDQIFKIFLSCICDECVKSNLKGKKGIALLGDIAKENSIKSIISKNFGNIDVRDIYGRGMKSNGVNDIDWGLVEGFPPKQILRVLRQWGLLMEEDIIDESLFPRRDFSKNQISRIKKSGINGMERVE